MTTRADALANTADGTNSIGDRTPRPWRDAADWLAGLSVLAFLATLIVVLP